MAFVHVKTLIKTNIHRLKAIATYELDFAKERQERAGCHMTRTRTAILTKRSTELTCKEVTSNVLANMELLCGRLQISCYVWQFYIFFHKYALI